VEIIRNLSHDVRDDERFYVT